MDTFAGSLSQLPILADPGYLEDPANCPYPGPYPELNSTLGQGHAAWHSTNQLRSLKQGPDDPNPAPPAWLLLSSSAQILSSTCSVALALALCYSALLLRRPSVAVAVAVGGQVLGPMVAGMYLMYTGTAGEGEARQKAAQQRGNRGTMRRMIAGYYEGIRVVLMSTHGVLDKKMGLGC